MLSQHGKHPPRDTHHLVHVRTHQTQNRHVGRDRDLAALLERLLRQRHALLVQAAGVDRQRHVHLARGDEVDGDVVLVQDREDPEEEAVRDGPLVGVDVDDADVVLDRHRRRPSRLPPGRGRTGLRFHGGLPGRCARDHARAVAARVVDVLDPDGYRGHGVDDLVHGEVVDDLGAVKGQLGRLRGCDGR